MPGLACARAWAWLTHDEKMRGNMLTRYGLQPGFLRRLVTSTLLIPLLAACGTLEVGFEDRATPTGVVTAPVQTVEMAETRLQANDHSSSPGITSDGRYVVFSSAADNLVPGDTNKAADIFVYDRETGIVESVTHAAQE